MNKYIDPKSMEYTTLDKTGSSNTPVYSCYRVGVAQRVPGS
jgi:hypothetical protein